MAGRNVRPAKTDHTDGRRDAARLPGGVTQPCLAHGQSGWFGWTYHPGPWLPIPVSGLPGCIRRRGPSRPSLSIEPLQGLSSWVCHRAPARNGDRRFGLVSGNLRSPASAGPGDSMIVNRPAVCRAFIHMPEREVRSIYPGLTSGRPGRLSPGPTSVWHRVSAALRAAGPRSESIA